MQIDYPYRIDARGRTAAVGDEEHIRDLMEQVLFTSPGERVNRPTFGSGVLQLVFQPNSEALEAATQHAVRSALQQWLAEVIEVSDVQVEARDSTLQLTVAYIVRRTQERQVAQFNRRV